MAAETRVVGVGGGEKRSGSGHILQIKPTGFLAGLEVSCEDKKEQRCVADRMGLSFRCPGTTFQAPPAGTALCSGARTMNQINKDTFLGGADTP